MLEDGVIDTAPMIRAILEDTPDNAPLIPTRFINTLSELIAAIAAKTPELPVILSGGVFQNKTLVDIVSQRLDTMGILQLPASLFPVNDGGIAAGQIGRAVFDLAFYKG
jgi:hydrogenase maturation protein HypF